MRHRAAGIDDGPVLPDLGPEWLQRKHALQAETLRALQDAPPRGDHGLRAALTERLERERLLFDTGFTLRLAAADGVDAGIATLSAPGRVRSRPLRSCIGHATFSSPSDTGGDTVRLGG